MDAETGSTSPSPSPGMPAGEGEEAASMEMPDAFEWLELSRGGVEQSPHALQVQPSLPQYPSWGSWGSPEVRELHSTPPHPSSLGIQKQPAALC